MGEFTTSKYSEQEVNEMVRAHTGGSEDIWEQHQTWKTVWIGGVRILRAFKRQTDCIGGKPAKEPI